jgi:hypothetical protein
VLERQSHLEWQTVFSARETVTLEETVTPGKAVFSRETVAPGMAVFSALER